MVLTTLGNIWLTNRTDSEISLGPGELFGFNVGSYVEIQSGNSGETVSFVFGFVSDNWFMFDVFFEALYKEASMFTRYFT